MTHCADVRRFVMITASWAAIVACSSEPEPTREHMNAQRAAAGSGPARCLLCKSSGASAGMGGRAPDVSDGGPEDALDDADGGKASSAGSFSMAASGNNARIEPPAPEPPTDDCITTTGAGDHTFTCDGIRYLTLVSEPCTRTDCGLIFEVHAQDMSAASMRVNTRLQSLAPTEGFIVVHPSAPSGKWDIAKDPPLLAQFVERMRRMFRVDNKRIHVTGFGMGGTIAFWFLCNRMDVLASAAVASGTDVDPPACFAALNADWRPRVPILFMNGRADDVLIASAATMRVERLVAQLGLSGGEVIDGDASYTRKRYRADDGMVLDFLEHTYRNLQRSGHCIPGGSASDTHACMAVSGGNLNWGRTALSWMVEHPKP